VEPAPYQPSVRYAAVLRLLQAADTLWSASRDFFARWDLSPSEFNVLNVLDGREEGLSQTELSRELLMHRSNLTGLVDRLEQRRLVVRRDVAGDRRAYCVVLTAPGTALLRRVLPHYHQAAEAVAAHLSPARATELERDLQGIVENARLVAAGEGEKKEKPIRRRP